MNSAIKDHGSPVDSVENMPDAPFDKHSGLRSNDCDLIDEEKITSPTDNSQDRRNEQPGTLNDDLKCVDNLWKPSGKPSKRRRLLRDLSVIAKHIDAVKNSNATKDRVQNDNDNTKQNGVLNDDDTTIEQNDLHNDNDTTIEHNHNGNSVLNVVENYINRTDQLKINVEDKHINSSAELQDDERSGRFVALHDSIEVLDGHEKILQLDNNVDESTLGESNRAEIDSGLLNSNLENTLMVLESKTATSHHHHHHHLPSSPHHDYGSLVNQVDASSDTYPLRSKSPQHHVVELPPRRTNTTPLPAAPEYTPHQSEDQQPEVEESSLSLNPTAVGSKAVGTMTSNQGLNDLYQRTPLLGSANTNGGPEWAEVNSNGGVAKILFTSGEEERKKKGAAGGGGVRIEMGGVGEHPRFPEEKWKTFIAFLILVFNLLLTTTSLAVVHEWVPDRKIYQPLPDIFLDAVPATDWTLYMSEILIMISTNVMVVVVLVHRHRFIILRRLFLMLALLYLMRSITMFVTVLPMSSRTYTCAEKANSTSPRLIATRVIQLFSGFGLSINGKHTFCGDYIYSGHTTILAMAYLMIHEYSPKRYFLLHWAAFVSAVVGVIMVLVAHGHYTVDVLIAYYITTRLFWVYHTLANNASLKQRTPYNYLSNVWWFRLFQYFEGNVGAPLPRQYETPLQILRKYTSYGHGTRDS